MMRWIVLVAVVVCVVECGIRSDLSQLERDLATLKDLKNADDHADAQNAIEVSSAACQARGGVCKNPSGCTGEVLRGLCPGGGDNRCCVSGSGNTGSDSGNGGNTDSGNGGNTDSGNGGNTDSGNGDNTDSGNGGDNGGGSTNSAGGISIQKVSQDRYKVTIGDRSVTFSFCNNRWHGDRPHTLGGCRNIVYEGNPSFRFTVEDFTRAGMGPSASKIAYGISTSEAGGKWGNLNTYDNEIVSWGGFQFSGKGGALTVVLGKLATNPRTSEIIKKYLGDNGVDIQFIDPRHPGWGAKLTIKQCDWERDPGCRRGSTGTIVAKPREVDGWKYMRDRADLMGAMYLLGTEKEIAMGQVLAWWSTFAAGALGVTAADGRRASNTVTSEYAMSRYLYGYNGLPAHARNAFKSYAASHPGAWTQSQLDEFAGLASRGHTYARFDAAIGSQISHAVGSWRG